MKPSEDVTIFVDSVKFLEVASGLRKLIRGEQLNDHEREAIVRTGRLLGGALGIEDLDGIAVDVTNFEAEYYRAIVALELEVDEDYHLKVQGALASVSCGDLNPEGLERVYDIFSYISEEKLAELNRRSLRR